ncbi:interferon-induced protein 44-like isoform X2 [Mya arenaria]|uniref:interferon-induced protein 44-like isoform X2 n=1 Tax=Mya arenaria TaxID=6604 RepID=UPI0022E65BF3|nr:interferon-induced protein 44-like isoform X2 [Mya arenaria]
MAGKLTKEHMNLLEGMIGCGPKSFKLLYSITRDGCSAAEFHRKCDNQGPTVTVLLNPQGSVYGGYAGINWKSTGGFTMDDTAFIFQLVFSGIRVVNIFRPKDASKALYFGCNRSAWFGNPDFEPFLNTISVNKDGTFSLNGRLTLGTCYNSNNVSNDAIHNGSMVVTELEVYAVSDDTRTSTPKQTTWRKTPALNEEYISKIAEELASITPPRGSGITDFRLLLVGPVGAGKSSFINTVMSPFADRIINKAAVGTSSQNVTRKYITYPVRKTGGSCLNFRLCDTPGIGDHSGMDAVNINFLLDGHVHSSFEFSYSRHISAKTPGFVHRPSLAEEAHCVGIVLDSSTIHDLPAVTMTLLNELKNLALEKGIPLAIVLTKIDKLHEDIAENLADVFNRPEVKAVVDQVSEALGIPPNHVFPVKNYHSEMETEVAVHGLVLIALRKMLFIALDALEERTSANEEGQEANADVTESDTA